jgi:hypothetical protein
MTAGVLQQRRGGRGESDVMLRGWGGEKRPAEDDVVVVVVVVVVVGWLQGTKCLLPSSQSGRRMEEGIWGKSGFWKAKKDKVDVPGGRWGWAMGDGSSLLCNVMPHGAGASWVVGGWWSLGGYRTKGGEREEERKREREREREREKRVLK